MPQANSLCLFPLELNITPPAPLKLSFPARHFEECKDIYEFEIFKNIYQFEIFKNIYQFECLKESLALIYFLNSNPTDRIL